MALYWRMAAETGEQIDTLGHEIRNSYAAAIQHNRETGGSLWRTMLAAQADGDPDEMDRLLRIADAARARHEDTPYDDMLARGISRDTARMLAQSMEGKNGE